jgi:transposase
VDQIGIDFADKHSLYTAPFENIVIDKLKGATVKAVAHDMGLSWDAIDNGRKRAALRGLARRPKIEVQALGIDGTSRGSHYDFVTVLVDQITGNVIDVLDGKNADCVIQWFNSQIVADLTGLRYISMDMSNAFISAVKKCFPDWDELIVFDRFHVVKMFLVALNKVRAREHKKFLENGGDSVLTKLKFDLFRNSKNTENRSNKRRGFLDIMRMHLQSSRAWKIKETQNSLWEYGSSGI